MTQRRALGDLEFDSAYDDPDNGWFGHVRAAPADARGSADARQETDLCDDVDDSAEDTDRWFVQTIEPAPPPAGPRVNRHDDAWAPRVSAAAAWDFTVVPARPSHGPRLVIAGIVVAVLATSAVTFLLLGRDDVDGPAPRVSPTAPTAPTAPTTAPAAGIPALPTASLAPMSPPPPPPPDEVTPPVVTRDYPPRRQTSPQESDRPEIGVTRAPATRTQMSATPPQPPPPDRNSSTPGDSPKRHRGFF